MNLYNSLRKRWNWMLILTLCSIGLASMAWAEPVSIVCLGPTRTYSNFDFCSETNFSDLKAAMNDPNNFPDGFTYTSIAQVTPEALANANMVITGLIEIDGNSAGVLSTSEQDALLNFVKAGGTLWVQGENFNFDANTNTITAPFGVTTGGNLTNAITITNTGHPLITGKFGTVTRITVAGGGNITNGGSTSMCVANTDQSQCGVLVLDRSTNFPGDGAVVVTLDVNTFISAGSTALINDADNKKFALNIIQYLMDFAPDADDDGIPDSRDNCPETANEDQSDRDLDGFGDVCDNCPDTPNEDQDECACTCCPPVSSMGKTTHKTENYFLWMILLPLGLLSWLRIRK